MCFILDNTERNKKYYKMDQGSIWRTMGYFYNRKWVRWWRTIKWYHKNWLSGCKYFVYIFIYYGDKKYTLYMYMCWNMWNYKNVRNIWWRSWRLRTQNCDSFTTNIVAEFILKTDLLNIRGYRKQIRGLVTIFVCSWVGHLYGL